MTQHSMQLGFGDGETSAAPPFDVSAALHMIRADVDVRAFHRWAGGRGMSSRNAFDPGFAMHCLLTESFGRERAPKPYRLILPRDSRENGREFGTLYGYGAYGADALREEAQVYACPLQSRILPASSIDSKRMPNDWRVGQRLGFEVLIRPIVRVKGKERDAFQVEAERRARGGMDRTREQVYADWLSERLAPRGARLLEARLQSFQRLRVVRKLGARATEGPDALMRGSLAITDTPEFARLVSNGVGRHRAYGYGMLLLRPAQA